MLDELSCQLFEEPFTRHLMTLHLVRLKRVEGHAGQGYNVDWRFYGGRANGCLQHRTLAEMRKNYPC